MLQVSWCLEVCDKGPYASHFFLMPEQLFGASKVFSDVIDSLSKIAFEFSLTDAHLVHVQVLRFLLVICFLSGVFFFSFFFRAFSVLSPPIVTWFCFALASHLAVSPLPSHPFYCVHVIRSSTHELPSSSRSTCPNTTPSSSSVPLTSLLICVDLH